MNDLAFLRHGKDSRERQTLSTRVKTAHLLANAGRKHGYSALNEIHAGCPLASVAIKSRVRFDEVGDVSDVHAYIISAVVIGLDGQCVIKVLSSLGINGENALLTKILSDFILSLWDAVENTISSYLGRR